MGLKVDFKPRLVYIQLESGDAYIDPRLDRAVRDRLMRYGPRFEEKVVIGLSPSQEEIQVRRTEKKGRGEGRLKDLTAVLLCMVLNPYRDPRFLRVSGSEDKARGSIGSWFECPTNVAAARLEHWALGYWWLSCAACERCAGKCEEPPQVLKEWARNAEVAREFEAPIRRAVSTATGEITEGAGQELCDAQELRTLPVADEAYGSEVAIQLKSIRLKDLSQVAARHLGNGGLITVAAWMLAQTHRFTLSTAFFIAASIGNSCIA
ncbi:hypothetical protein B0H19DRAFT_1066194 [Mycena capillaripes]|nr:hypothetical protein B0H19DRAFT_1066194 [Mycena capillaripes]